MLYVYSVKRDMNVLLPVKEVSAARCTLIPKQQAFPPAVVVRLVMAVLGHRVSPLAMLRVQVDSSRILVVHPNWHSLSPANW